MAPAEEVALLKQQAESFASALEDIKQRIAELETPPQSS
jgi:hypothetical protein